jgi:hypothetical protein
MNLRFSMGALLCGMCYSQAIHAQPFASAREALKAPREHVIAAYALRPPNPADPLEKLLIEEMDGLNRIAPPATELWISASSPILSHPTVGIIIDRQELEAHLAGAQAQRIREMVRVVLTHEKAHQIQFATYSTGILDLNAEERRAYEAQADLLSGKYLAETNPPDNTSEGDERTIEDALILAFNLGTREYALGTHPSHEARRTSVRLGMAAGMMTSMRARGFLVPAGVLAQKLDVGPTDELLPWSLRTARRIVNYRRPDILNLVLDTANVSYNVAGNPPIVTYLLRYRNTGSTPLHVDLEVQCVSVPRDDRDDTMRWKKVSVRNHRFTLGPGQMQTLTGTLEWVATPDLMPRLVFPPDGIALVSAVTDAAPSAGNEPVIAALAPRLDRAVEEDLKSTLIDLVTQASFGGFSALRAGPGQRIFNEIEYPSRIALPGAQETEVSLPIANGGRESITAIFVESEQPEPAIDTWERIVAIVAAAFPDWARRDTGLETGRATTTFENRQLRTRIRIRLSETRSRGKFVQVTIEAPRSS